MNRGRFEQVAAPEQVYAEPTTSFVAGFIGVSNLMPGSITSASGGRARVRLDSGVEVEAPADGYATDERCFAVVRPEKLKIAARNGGPAAAGHSVDGTVESSIYLGTSTQIVVDLGGDVRMTVLVPNADEAERARLPGGGAPVTLSWAPENVHVVRDSSQVQSEEGR
jgi:spermidine/putrescine transport system ATP-binding protein